MQIACMKAVFGVEKSDYLSMIRISEKEGRCYTE
jgi:hypothetical protein